MDDIRARHDATDTVQTMDGAFDLCECGQESPCDAAVAIARADAAEAQLAAAVAVLEDWQALGEESATEHHLSDIALTSRFIQERDAARALADELPDLITRWLMGEGMAVVYRWMITGWRETMYDEGVAMWTAALAKWEASK